MKKVKRKMRLKKITLAMLEAVVPRIILENHYEEMLNDISEPVDVFGVSLQKGTLLRYEDEVAFRTGMLDYVDSMKRDGLIADVEGSYFWISDIENVFQLVE